MLHNIISKRLVYMKMKSKLEEINVRTGVLKDNEFRRIQEKLEELSSEIETTNLKYKYQRNNSSIIYSDDEVLFNYYEDYHYWDYKVMNPNENLHWNPDTFIYQTNEDGEISVYCTIPRFENLDEITLAVELNLYESCVDKLEYNIWCKTGKNPSIVKVLPHEENLLSIIKRSLRANDKFSIKVWGFSNQENLIYEEKEEVLQTEQNENNGRLEQTLKELAKTKDKNKMSSRRIKKERIRAMKENIQLNKPWIDSDIREETEEEMSQVEYPRIADPSMIQPKLPLFNSVNYMMLKGSKEGK